MLLSALLGEVTKWMLVNVAETSGRVINFEQINFTIVEN